MLSYTKFHNSKHAVTGMNSGFASFVHPDNSIILEKSSVSETRLIIEQKTIKAAFVHKTGSSKTFAKMIFCGE